MRKTKLLATGLEWNGLWPAKTAAASFNFRPLIANWYKNLIAAAVFPHEPMTWIELPLDK
jgi:hypothetical protein